MKILIINKHIQDYIGGSEIQCDLIASNLKEFGHSVTYGIINSRNQYELDYDWVLLKKPLFRSLYKTLKKLRPDIIYWRYNKNSLLISTLLAKLFKVKFIFSVSSFSDTRRWIWAGTTPLGDNETFFKKLSSLKGFVKLLLGFRYPLKSFYNYFGFYFADGVVSLNSDYLNRTPPKKQVTIHNSMLANLIDFKWNKPYVVWISNLKPTKHPEKYVELARNMENMDIDFLMVGAYLRKRYSFIQDKKKLPHNLHFLGGRPINEVNGIIKSSLFLVHTCDPEGFGNIFIQAWLQAKPCVSLYFDPESMIKKNKIGFYSGSMENMIRDVKKLVENKSLRDQMGQRALKFAQENFAPEKNARKLEEFLLDFTK
jgi:glycosyltransferase involved in cell wall biosynthesis